jgi:tetratricopeptide (TPR) repeat protein
MAKEGLTGIVCALALIPAAGEIRALRATGEDRDRTVAAQLAVQSALHQGRDFLQRGDARSAVHVLEGQLGRINGDAAYLTLLRDAYRAYVKELRLSRQESEAQRYLQRLQVLDPGAALDLPQARPANSPPAASSPSTPAVEPKVRMHREEPDQHGKKTEGKLLAGTWLARAEEAYAGRRFPEAARFYEQAHQADPAATGASLERWAYCKLYGVFEHLKAPPKGGPAAAELEKEVRQAIQLAPRLQEYAQTLLVKIDQRRGPATSSNPPAAAPVQPVRHNARGSDAWARAETANFRIFHNQTRELAEQVAHIAERTRGDMSQKWLGGAKEAWNPRCDIYLHGSGHDYSRATGVASNSPGHSTIKNEGSRILGRRIDLHCDDLQNLLTAILPHETTHIVLAGQIGDQPLARWADEGIAVLTEPPDRVERHRRNLHRCRQDNSLFSVRQLLQLADYPEPRHITAFYAQSVSLVEFLSGLKGPQVFTQFLRDALKLGYEQALSRHYGYRSYEELQQRWAEKAFATHEVTTDVVQRVP